MKLLVKLFGVLMIVSGIFLLFFPEGAYNWAEINSGSIIFYLSIVAIRLILGTSLILTAKESKYPSVIKFLGYLTLVAALMVIIMGRQGFQDFIASMIPIIKPYAPISGLIGISLGLFLFYAYSKQKGG